MNFPESGRGLGHMAPQFLAVRSAILATAWLLVKTGRHNSVLLGTPTKISGLPRNSKFIGDINRVGIVGVGWGVEPLPQFMSTDAHV